jgi:hypothetical protein
MMFPMQHLDVVVMVLYHHRLTDMSVGRTC